MRSYARQNGGLAKRYDQWMVAMHYVHHTQHMYRRMIRQFLEFLGEKSAVRVTHWDIRQYIALVSQKGASLDMTYRQLSVLRLFYDFLNLGGVVSYVAPRLVKLRKPPSQGGRWLTESQVERLIAASMTLRERAIVEFFYGTGCRLSEVRHLKIEDVVLDDRVARVVGKFGKVRSVLLTHSTVAALRSYIGDRTIGFVFRPDMPMQRGCVAKRGNYWVGLWVDYRGPGPKYPRMVKVLGRIDLVPYESAKLALSDSLEPDRLRRPEINRPLSKVAVATLLKKVGERAGLRDVGPHMLRRSFATHLRDHGADLQVIQTLLGHVYLATTAKYTRLSTGKILKTFDRCHPRRKMRDQLPEKKFQDTAESGNSSRKTTSL
jgi:site-specific recombinase XerD